MLYGLEVKTRSAYANRRCMSVDSLSMSGNLGISVGPDYPNKNGVWKLPEQVVLTPSEAREMAEEILRIVDDPKSPQWS